MSPVVWAKSPAKVSGTAPKQASWFGAPGTRHRWSAEQTVGSAQAPQLAVRVRPQLSRPVTDPHCWESRRQKSASASCAQGSHRRVTASQPKSAGQESGVHSQAPEVGAQLSPAAQVTPAQKSTQSSVGGSQRRVGSAAVQESGALEQLQVALAPSQLSPAAQPAGAQASMHRAVAASQRVAGAAAVQVSAGSGAQRHCPSPGSQLSPGVAQTTPWQTGTQARAAGSQRVPGAAAAQESGAVAHSHWPVAPLQLSPGAAQATPSQMSTQRRLAASHFSPAGQVFGAVPQAQAPLVATHDSPAGQLTPRHLETHLSVVPSQRRSAGQREGASIAARIRRFGARLPASYALASTPACPLHHTHTSGASGSLPLLGADASIRSSQTTRAPHRLGGARRDTA